MFSSQPNFQPVRMNQQEIKKRYASIASVYDIWGRLTESRAQTRCLELAAIVDGESVYRFQPRWLGGCRGVSLLSYVEQAGFSNTRREFISQMTFPSEIIYGERDG